MVVIRSLSGSGPVQHKSSFSISLGKAPYQISTLSAAMPILRRSSMKNPRSFSHVLCLMFLLACAGVSAFGQTAEDKNRVATMSASGSNVRWEMGAAYSSLTMTVSAPDGRVFRKEFKAGAAPEFTIIDAQGERLPDGQYIYELRMTPSLSPEAKEALAAARGKDDDAESVRATRK